LLEDVHVGTSLGLSTSRRSTPIQRPRSGFRSPNDRGPSSIGCKRLRAVGKAEHDGV
jgi:hypothetical protein